MRTFGVASWSVLSLMASAASLIAACTSAPSNNESGPAAPPSDIYDVSVQVSALSDLPKCAAPLYGTTALVQSPLSLYSCQSPGLWIAIPCLNIGAGSVAYASATKTLIACVSGQWTQIPLPQGPQGATGAQGQQGSQGAPGVSPQVTETTLEPGDPHCPSGGTKIVVVTPDPNGGVGSTQTAYACNGAPGAAAAVCPAPASLCIQPAGGVLYCADLRSDSNNCGVCGTACAAGTVCNAGVCGCSAGMTDCGGACTNLETDSNNCGACGTACATGAVCDAGMCACSTGMTACGSACTNFETDSNNCGACGTACAGGMGCNAGTCACAAGTTDCGGACTNLLADANNCGACGAACASGQVCDGTGACVVAGNCGNGVIEIGEQCDDGNLFNLDGCDATCHYEVVTRATSFAISGTQAPAALHCTPSTNRFGTQALTGTALTQLNPQLTTNINSGAVNVMTQFLGLQDATGVSSAPFSLGFLDGTPDPAKGAWPGNNLIDWWFLADQANVDARGLPVHQFANAVLMNRSLTAGPANIDLALDLSGTPQTMTMLNAHIAATINGNPAPNVPAAPPAAIAAGLAVFQTMTANGAGQGICGNLTVSSLAAIPVPSVLTGGGSAACGNCGASHAYNACVAGQTPLNSTCNSMLDVLVGGCNIACFITAVNATQPDVPAGATVTHLTLGAGNKVPVATTTNDNDAYSAYFVFTANRAHFTGESCSLTSDCQTGKTCSAGVCR